MDTKLETYSTDGSPYSKRKREHDPLANESEATHKILLPSPTELTIEAQTSPTSSIQLSKGIVENSNRQPLLDTTIIPGKSPYSRRYPIMESSRKENQWISHSSDSDLESEDGAQKPNLIEGDEAKHHDDSDEGHDNVGETKVQDCQLPATIERRPSIMTLRNRRDQQYQGFRSHKPKRLMNKTGNRNVIVQNLPLQFKFFKDIVTTMVEEQWRFTLTIFVLSYFLSWLIFALLWYVIAYAHGDLEFDAEGNRLGEGRQECVRGATSFAGFFLLSIETQVSTGFGERYPTEECPEALFLLVVQLVIGLVIDGAMVGIVYVKLIRPSRKNQDMKFSKKIVVCQRDGKLCLLFRICDPRLSHYIATKVKVILVEQKRPGADGKPEYLQLPIKLDNRGRMIMIWPLIMCHTINKTSPFYDLSAKDLLAKKFEILVTLTGDSKVTGQTTQARTSYLNNEIMWGHRFVNMLIYDEERETYVVQNEKFNVTEEVDTPLCSAKRMDEILDELHEHGYGDNDNLSEHPANFYIGSSMKEENTLQYSYSHSLFDKVDEVNETEEKKDGDDKPVFQYTVEAIRAVENEKKRDNV